MRASEPVATVATITGMVLGAIAIGATHLAPNPALAEAAAVVSIATLFMVVAHHVRMWIRGV